MNSKIKNQKGNALLITIFLLASILLIAFGVANLLIPGIRMGRTAEYSTKAYYATEAGAERSLWELRKNDYSLPENSAADVFTNEDIGNNSSFEVAFTRDDPFSVFTSVGEYSNTKRSVEVSFAYGSEEEICDPVCSGCQTCQNGVCVDDNTTCSIFYPICNSGVCVACEQASDCGDNSSCVSSSCVCNSGWGDCNYSRSCTCDLSTRQCYGGNCICQTGLSDCDGDGTCECDVTVNECVEGVCSGCTPDCDGLECGDDGCGGSCGICGDNSTCSSGLCSCDSGYSDCNSDGDCECNTSTHECSGTTCTEICVPDCSGLECGDDGCGGSCGTCGANSTCSSGLCSCDSGYSDCDGDGECECDTITNECSGTTCVAQSGGSSTGINLLNSLHSGGVAEVVYMGGTANIYAGDLTANCSAAWRPQGSLCDEGDYTDSKEISYKSRNNSGATWNDGSDDNKYGTLIVDLKSVQTFDELIVFQMFSDGKTTHIRFAIHSETGETYPGESDAGWNYINDFSLVGAGSNLGGNQVGDPTAFNFVDQSTRYLRIDVKNVNGYYDGGYWIELREVKMFDN